MAQPKNVSRPGQLFDGVEQIGAAKEQQRTIAEAFEIACQDLGLDLGSMNVSKRERLAHLILQFAASGQQDSDRLRRDAVKRFREADAQAPQRKCGSRQSVRASCTVERPT